MPAPDSAEPLAPPPFGRLGELDAQPDGSGVQCHLCGRSFARLGLHARRTHRLAPEEYRERFGLNRQTPLVAPALAARLAAAARAQDRARVLAPWRWPPGSPPPLGGPQPARRLEARLTYAAVARVRRRVTVACPGCGRPVETAAHRAGQPTYCPTCAPDRARARHRERERRRRARRRAAAAAAAQRRTSASG